MATTAIPVSEYLHTFWQPDRDYVDGEVVERHLGEREPAIVQGRVLKWFFDHEDIWHLQVLPEQRVQIRPQRYRVPDVSVLRSDAPFEKILTQPPIAVIEVLSPEDRMNTVRERLEDYISIGVNNIWVLDPYTRQAWTYSAIGYTPVEGDRFAIAGSDIHLPVASAFAGLPPIE